MYPLRPVKAYMLDAVAQNPASLARMERILRALGLSMGNVIPINRKNVYEVALELLAWPMLPLSPDYPAQHQRPLVFTHIILDRMGRQAAWPASRPRDIRNEMVRHIQGRMPLTQRVYRGNPSRDSNVVCWKSLDFCVMSGCPHGCHYCVFGKWGSFITVGLNIEDYIVKVVGPTIEKNPSQKCFGIIGPAADVITFEPEYGAFAAFLEKLSQYEGRYGYFHTSSDNVDWVASVPHRDRLIGVWSITSEAVARIIEPGSPPAIRRIQAARKCQDLCVPIRFKFKPVVPVRNWREEYAQTIEAVFKHTRPESVGFCVVMWMNLDELRKRIDLDLLDPSFVTEAQKAEEELKGRMTGPFPHRVRAEIYRFLIREVRRWDRKIPIFISTESREMWDELAGELGQNPRAFVCGCNPIQLPGPRLEFSRHLKSSTYVTRR